MRFYLVLLFQILLLCNLNSEARKTITIWAMGAEGEKLPLMVSEFEKEHPDIKVEVQAIPWGAALEKLLTAVVGKVAPDICQMGTTWMAQFQAMNAFLPLNDFIEKSEVIDKEKFFSGSWSTVEFNGNVYGIPWYVDTRVLFYRKDILKGAGFNHPPRNWDELQTIGKSLVKDINNDGKIDKYGMALPTNDPQTISMFIWQNDGDILSDDKTIPTVMDQKVVDAVKFYASIFDNNIAPVTNPGIDLFQAFRTGFYSMFISGPWMVELVAREMPELTGNWDVSVLPGNKSGTSFIGGCNLVIFKDSQNKLAAWKFLEFMSRKENQIEWFKITKDLPSIKLAWDDKYFVDKPMMKTFGKQLLCTKAPPSVTQWSQIETSIGFRIEEAIMKQKTIPEALAALNTDITSVMSGQQKIDQFQKLFFVILPGFILLALIFFSTKSIIRYTLSESKRIRKKIINFRLYSHIVPYSFVLPSLLLLVVFLFIPIIISFVLSFTNWDVYTFDNIRNLNFQGLNNYISIFNDRVFWKALFNTLIFAGVGVPLGVLVSLMMALILNSALVKFRNLFRLGYFIPVITTLVAVAVIWRWIYNPDYGLLNWLFQLFNFKSQNWLNDTRLALPSLILMATWKNFGYNMVIFLAGLQAIPSSLYEAASIDGADDYQQFLYITLPALKPIMIFVVILTAIGYLQFFAEPYVMTQGGPLNSTISVVMYMYNQGFKFFKFAQSSAVAYIFFVIIVGITLLQNKLKKRRE